MSSLPLPLLHLLLSFITGIPFNAFLMWKCNSEGMPLGVATISQTPSNWAAAETPIFQAHSASRVFPHYGGGRSLDSKKSFRMQELNENTVNTVIHPRRLQ